MWPLFSKPPTVKQKWLHGIISILIIIGSLSFFWFAKGLDWRYLVTLKYLGFAIIAFFGSAIVFLPFPLTVLMGISALFLHPVVVILLGGLVVSIGSMVPYLVGAEGKIIFADIKGYKRVHAWATRNTHGFWSILLISIIPFPLFDLICVSAGILGIKPRKYFLAILIGKIISYSIAVGLFYYLASRFPEFLGFVKSYLQ